MGMQETREEDDFEAVIKFQESPQNIRLIPGKALSYPIGRIFKRPEDIVEVNQDTGFQCRQNLKYDPVDVASQFGYMC